jgi:hypothetical protein
MCNQYTRKQVMQIRHILGGRVQPINQKKGSNAIQAKRISYTGKFSVVQEKGG